MSKRYGHDSIFFKLLLLRVFNGTIKLRMEPRSPGNITHDLYPETQLLSNYVKVIVFCS